MQTMPTMQTVRKLQMANGAQLHLKGITTDICPNHNNNEQQQRAAAATATGQQQFAPFLAKRRYKRWPH